MAERYLIDADILILSGASGVGKGTVGKILQTRKVNGRSIEIIRSATNREPRPDEHDYIFVSQEEFDHMVETEQFLEYNTSYADNSYGTPLVEVERCLSANAVPCLEINRTGLGNLLREGKVNPAKIHSVFLVAPASVIADRLLKRNTESTKDIIQRLRISIQEIKHLDLYDAVIINDVVEDTVTEALRAFNGEKILFFFDKEKYCNEMTQIIHQLESKHD